MIWTLRCNNNAKKLGQSGPTVRPKDCINNDGKQFEHFYGLIVVSKCYILTYVVT